LRVRPGRSKDRASRGGRRSQEARRRRVTLRRSDNGGRGHAVTQMKQRSPIRTRRRLGRPGLACALRARPLWDRTGTTPGTHSRWTRMSSRSLHSGTRSARVSGSCTVRPCTVRVNPYVHDGSGVTAPVAGGATAVAQNDSPRPHPYVGCPPRITSAVLSATRARPRHRTA
jgi:hypothetical protein